MSNTKTTKTTKNTNTNPAEALRVSALGQIRSALEPLGKRADSIGASITNTFANTVSLASQGLLSEKAKASAERRLAGQRAKLQVSLAFADEGLEAIRTRRIAAFEAAAALAEVLVNEA